VTVRALLGLAALALLAGCGASMEGPGVPRGATGTAFGWRTMGEIQEGWLIVSQKSVGCGDIEDVITRDHDAGDAIWIGLEKGPTLDWVGLYPGTFAADATGESLEGRHAEVYFQQAGDVAALTGHDVWVEVYSYGAFLEAELDTNLAAGLIVSKDCGEL